MSVKVYNFDNFKKEETSGKKTVTSYVLFADFDAEISKRDEEIKDLQSKYDRVVKGLGFYADEKNWYLSKYGDCQQLKNPDGEKVNGNDFYNEKGGKLARQILKEVVG